MTFDAPTPFEEAVRKLRERIVVTSPLRSAEWRSRVAVGLRDRAFFSATVESARILQTMQDYLVDYLEKAIDPSTGGLRAQGRSEFVADMRELCMAEGIGKLDPTTGRIDPEIDETDLTDLRSMARLQLIFDTQMEAAHEYGYWSQGNDPDVLNAYPASRFIRVRPVRVPRPIHAAHEGVVRRKDDLDFWIAMNPDFGVPYGPWGFNSGMGVEDVDRIEAEQLGLVAPGERLTPQDRDFNERLSASVRDLSDESRARLRKIFGDQVTERDGRMEWVGSRSTPQPVQRRTKEEIRAAVLSAATKSAALHAIQLAHTERGQLLLHAPQRGRMVDITQQAQHFLEGMVHRDWLHIDYVTVVGIPPGRRGKYTPWTKTAHCPPHVGTVIHEIAHHIEMQNPECYRACLDFRKRRTPGETPKLLRSLTGNSAYRIHEVAYEDEWQARGGSHYMGRTYEYDGLPTTEILTMGLERLHSDPVGFAREDPDYFDFLISLMHKL